MIAGLFLGQLCLWVSAAAAQGHNPTPPQIQDNGNIELRVNDVQTNLCADMQKLVVTLVDENNAHLDRQVVVRLHDKKRGNEAWETSGNDSEVTFCGIDFGDYEVDTSAVGYLTGYRDWHIGGAGVDQARTLRLVMHKDPTTVELNAPDEAMPAAARKDTKLAVTALRSANFKEAQKRLDKAFKVAPSNEQINFLYGYLYMQQKNFDKAEEYLSRAATLDPRKAQALTLLGRVQLERHKYDAAQKTLEQAVAVNSSYWMAHNLLADTFLKQKDYEKARAQAQLAIDEGRGAGSVARLVMGEALANLGRNQDGIQELKLFMQSNASNPVIPQVKALIAEIENRSTAPASTAGTPLQADLALPASTPSLPESAWGPPGVDDVKPPVAAGITCPYQQVIEGSGERVKQFVDDIAKFAAIEDLVHEQLDKAGNPITKETRKFTYVASITEAQPGFLQTDE